MFGKSDPYVKLEFHGQEFQSRTINNSLNPEWNFSTDPLISEAYDKNINIEVYDEDYGQDKLEESNTEETQAAIHQTTFGSMNCQNCQNCKKCTSTQVMYGMTQVPDQTFKTADIKHDFLPDLAVLMVTMSANTFITLNQQNTLVGNFNTHDRWHSKINLPLTNFIHIIKQKIYGDTKWINHTTTKMASIQDFLNVPTDAHTKCKKCLDEELFYLFLRMYPGVVHNFTDLLMTA